MNDLLIDVMQRISNYWESLPARTVAPSPEAVADLDQLMQTLPEEGQTPAEVLALLDKIGSPATVASSGGRYFGFVTGGALPAASAANMLATAWDQNSGLYVMSPIAAMVEVVASDWLIDVLGLSQGTGVGFVTGATMANFSGLVAVRHALLARAGWDVERKGLYGAPEIKVVVGEEVHASMRKALNLIGFGSDRVVTVKADGQGRMRSDELPELDEMTLVCMQCGNVNSGSFDPVAEVSAAARRAGAWVHVDAAFGLWVRAVPELRHLAGGLEEVDSISTDAHKWLNVPYDCGLVFVREPQHLAAGMTQRAAYLIESERRDNLTLTPEMSRRARGIEVWAALLSLGKQGLARMVGRHCAFAQRFADGLSDAGFEILNEVVINQVLVSFGDDDTTRRVIAASQREGTMWAGGTVWHGRAAMRISVSGWATSLSDIDRCLSALIRTARAVESP